MRLYVAGPMRDYAEFNFPAFECATKALRELGHTVMSPAERDLSDGFDPAGMKGDLEEVASAGYSLREMLGADLAYICDEADAVIVLPDWGNSRGACAEVATARALSIPVFELHTFLRLACDSPQVLLGSIEPGLGGTMHITGSVSSLPPSSSTQTTPEQPEKETIDAEARRLVYGGERQKDYGHPRGDFDRIAKIWSAIVGTEVVAEQVAIMMAGLKLARLSSTFQHHDSKVDVIGYMMCLDRLMD